MKGRRKNDPHRAHQEIPVMSWGRIEHRGKDRESLEEEEGRSETIMGIDTENKEERS